MKYLNKFNESTNETKSILRDGFDMLIENTHLIQDQVRHNLDAFLDGLDVNKFENKFGGISKFLGAGVFGSVYQLDNGKILKITFDFHEAPFLYEYCQLNKIDGFVKVDAVYKIKFGNTSAYTIVRDPVQVITNRSEYQDEIRKAKDAMYKISPDWRGTHSGNFGVQNGEVVLYDGFCKDAPVNEKKIPILEL